MSEWVTKEEALSHADEYGRFSFECILIEILDDSGGTDYIDLIYDANVLVDAEIGRCLIVPALPCEGVEDE